MAKRAWLLVAVGLAAASTSCASSGVLFERRVQAVPFLQSGITPLDALTWAVQELLGYQVVVADMQPPTYLGHTVKTGEMRVIYLSKNLDDHQRFIVLMHEAAHTLQPMALDKAQEEAWAQTVSYFACKEWGVRDPTAERYAAQYKQGLVALRVFRDELNWAISVLSGRAVTVF